MLALHTYVVILEVLFGIFFFHFALSVSVVSVRVEGGHPVNLPATASPLKHAKRQRC